MYVQLVDGEQRAADVSAGPSGRASSSAPPTTSGLPSNGVALVGRVPVERVGAGRATCLQPSPRTSTTPYSPTASPRKNGSGGNSGHSPKNGPGDLHLGSAGTRVTLPSDLVASALRQPTARGAQHPMRVVTSVISRTVVGSMVGLRCGRNCPWWRWAGQRAWCSPAPCVPSSCRATSFSTSHHRATAHRRCTPPDPAVCLPIGSTRYFPTTT